MKSVLLAFSGGLDTTYCAVYLSKSLGYKVHLLTINTGGFSPSDILELEGRSNLLGASSFHCADMNEVFYNSCIRYLVYGNILKNGTYPLSVSAERMVQAVEIARYAHQLGVDAVAHGSTGAGNDQVRFDMVLLQMLPGCDILTPVRDQKLSREQEIGYLQEHGIQYDAVKAIYSINKGLWGTSVGGAETLTSAHPLPEHAWPTPATETTPRQVVLSFRRGELTDIDGQQLASPVACIQYLHTIAAPYGIGRDVHVGDTIIGIKGRVGFEAAAPIIIIKAHHLLEKHTLTKWQLFWKDQLAAWYGNCLHEGQMLDPTMRNIEAFLTDSQKTVTGDVYVTLHPYRFELTGISSSHDMMQSKFGKYGEMNNGWTGDDVRGFTRIFGNQTAIFHQVNSTIHEN